MSFHHDRIIRKSPGEYPELFALKEQFIMSFFSDIARY